MGAAYEIIRDEDGVTIRLPAALADEAQLAKLLDYLELEAVRQRSQLTEEDAATLAAEVKQGAWQQVKHLFKK